MFKKSNHGFTLIELLVAIAIIGILAVMVLVFINSSKTKAKDARIKNDLSQIKNLVKTYLDANPASNLNCSPIISIHCDNFSNSTDVLVKLNLVAADIKAQGSDLTIMTNSDGTYQAYTTLPSTNNTQSFVVKSDGTSFTTTLYAGLISWWKIDNNKLINIIGSENVAAEPLTISGRFKTSQSNSSLILFGLNGLNSDSTADQISLDNGKVSYFVRDKFGTASATVETSTSYTDGNWHCVVGIKNGNNISLYLDGNFISKTSANFTANLAGVFSIVKDSGSFTGTVDDVRVYNRVLTDEEIKTLASGG